MTQVCSKERHAWCGRCSDPNAGKHWDFLVIKGFKQVRHDRDTGDRRLMFSDTKRNNVSSVENQKRKSAAKISPTLCCRQGSFGVFFLSRILVFPSSKSIGLREEVPIVQFSIERSDFLLFPEWSISAPNYRKIGWLHLEENEQENLTSHDSFND